MKKQIPLMVFIAGVGVLIGLLLQRPGDEHSEQPLAPETATPAALPAANPQLPKDSDQPQETNDESDELTAMRELVQTEIQARKQLQSQLAEVTTRLDSLEKNLDKEPVSESTNAPPGDSTIVRTTNNRRGVSRPGWINTQAMLDAGLDEAQATKIRDVYEQVEMEKLYLRDRAIREGWIGDDRYRQESQQLDSRLESLRDELTEKEYDAYLFATGRPNRVVVESTLRTSPARDSGIRAGDNLIRYNNIRVYTWADLRNATTECTTDSMIEVELERDGRRQRVYVPCGPLGVRLDTTSIQP